MGPKVTYLKRIVLRPSDLGHYFKDFAPKITFLNRDLESLKPSNFWNWVQYQNLMVLRISKLRQIALKMGLKLIYLKLIVLKASVLGQYFKDLAPKIAYRNKDLGSLKPFKTWNWVKYQNLMVLRIFKIRRNCLTNGSQSNLCQVYSL